MQMAYEGIDVLINLAGLMDFQLFSEPDPGMLQQMLLINLQVPMQLAATCCPGMLAQGSGRIVNIGSMFGSIGYPGFAAYSASKFALRGFSQALRRELAGSGVGVTYVSPRGVRTAFNPRRGACHGSRRNDAHGRSRRGWPRTSPGPSKGNGTRPTWAFRRASSRESMGCGRGWSTSSLKRVVPAITRYARDLP